MDIYFERISWRIKQMYDPAKVASIRATRPARCGHTRRRLCPRLKYPLMAPDRDSIVITFTARTLGFMMVEAASLYR